MTLKKRMTSFINALEKLEHSESPSDSSLRANFYPFSNERGIATPLEVLKTRQPALFPKNTIRVAILVGQSSFCSLLAALSQHCDLVVFTDINPYLHQHTKKLLWLLQNTTTQNDFEIQYEKYKKNSEIHFNPCQTQPDFTMRKAILKEDHFLYNDKNFIAARFAAQKLQFAFSYVNLFNATNRKDFFNCFKRRKCAVTFINLTNLYEWDANISLARIEKKEEWRSKGQLKSIANEMHKYQPMIMFSLRKNATESCSLEMQIGFTFKDYFELNEKAVQHYLAERFPIPLTLQIPSTPNVSPTINNIRHQYLQEQIKPCDLEFPITNGRTFLPYQRLNYQLTKEHPRMEGNVVNDLNIQKKIF